MPVRIRSRQFRSDFRAIDGFAEYAQVAAKHCHVETREVEKFGHRRVGQKGRKIGRGVGGGSICIQRRRRKLDQMANAITCRQLNQAQAIPVGLEAHCFRVDGDTSTKIKPVWKIAQMEFDRVRT